MAFLVNFAEYLLPTLLTLGYSAYSLGSAKVDPFFEYDTEEFHKLQFSRGWSDIMTDNNAYAVQLGIALLSQKRGKNQDECCEELKKLLGDSMVPKCSDFKEVIRVCNIQKKPTEETPLNPDKS